MSFAEKVVEQFRSQVTSAYELEESVVDALCTYVSEAIEKVGVPTGRAGRTRRAPTTRRKKSGYNVFVRKMMSDDDGIKQLGHREKMAAIGARWKALAEEEQNKFKALADEENDAGAAPEEDAAEEEA